MASLANIKDAETKSSITKKVLLRPNLEPIPLYHIIPKYILYTNMYII